MKLAVLASHGGSVLQAILDACADGRLQCEVALVVSNNSNSMALRRAEAASVPTLHISSATHPDEQSRDAALTNALSVAGADLVMLAGYMKKLGPEVLARFRDRILNTHPALLPKFGGAGFYGRRVHEAVLAAGERESGVSVHIVTADYDSGPVVAQTRVPVLQGDSAADLEARVQNAERRLVVDTLTFWANSGGKLPEFTTTAMRAHAGQPLSN